SLSRCSPLQCHRVRDPHGFPDRCSPPQHHQSSLVSNSVEQIALFKLQDAPRMSQAIKSEHLTQKDEEDGELVNDNQKVQPSKLPGTTLSKCFYTLLVDHVLMHMETLF